MHSNVPEMLPGFSWLLLLGIMGVSWAQREVIVQQGPLYRTNGSHITIWCKVRGYQGPSQQHFRWSVYLPSAPEREVQVVSTEEDSSFSYAVYSQRVRDQDIYVERLSGDHSRLHIRQLQERDTGEYECHTPNTDPSYFGSYSAKMNLIVIPDNLKVTMPQQNLRKTEGDMMEMTCHVSKASAQHTHLSVTWLLTSENIKEMEILTLTRNFLLRPSHQYYDRFVAGEVRLDKLTETSYRLSILYLRVSDQGNVHCRASEWIQDPDKSWAAIKEKESDKSNLVVSPVKASSNPRLTLQSDVVLVQEGEAVRLRCRVQDFSGPLSVFWSLRTSFGQEMDVASLQRDGALTIGMQYLQRHVKGHLVTEKPGPGEFTLKLDRLTVTDKGRYGCQVTEWRLESNRGWRNTSVIEDHVDIDVKQLNSSLRVALIVRNAVVMLGDDVELFCSASADYSLGNRSLFWTWEFSPSSVPSRPFQTLVHKSPNGSLTWRASPPGAQLSVSESRSTMKIYRARRAQSGMYRCTVGILSEGLEVTLASAPSNNLMIQISLPGSRLTVDASSTNLVLRKGQDQVKVTCHVRHHTPRTFLSVSWLFIPRGVDTPREILRVTQEGVWNTSSPETGGSSFLSERVSSNDFTLRILRPGNDHLGSYKCAVQEWLLDEEGEWISLQQRTSGESWLTFERSEKSLNIPKADVVAMVTEGDDVVLHCPLGVVPNSASLYSVSWHQTEPDSGSHRLLMRVGWDGGVQYEDPLAKRLRLVSTSRGNYSLILQRVGRNDTGNYYCQAEEWSLEVSGGSWTMGDSDKSGYLRLNVTAPEDRLRLNLTALTISVPGGQQSLLLPCQVVSTSSVGSVLSVSWWWAPSAGNVEQLLLRASLWGEVVYAGEEDAGVIRLRYERPSLLHFKLRILQPLQENAGLYHCKVQEWAQDHHGAWHPGRPHRSGNISVTILPAGNAAKICSAPSIFYFLLTISLLFLLLVLTLVWMCVRRRRRIQSGKIHQNNRVSIWSSLRGTGIPMDGSVRHSEEVEKINGPNVHPAQHAD
uniref:Ig-like domain-containing protein n=1 Tax=Leptobrachium leishanense TaxID=445787 RepID=A0A8C5LQA6_9ANUR